MQANLFASFLGVVLFLWPSIAFADGPRRTLELGQGARLSEWSGRERYVFHSAQEAELAQRLLLVDQALPREPKLLQVAGTLSGDGSRLTAGGLALTGREVADLLRQRGAPLRPMPMENPGPFDPVHGVSAIVFFGGDGVFAQELALATGKPVIVPSGGFEFRSDVTARTFLGLWAGGWNVHYPRGARVTAPDPSAGSVPAFEPEIPSGEEEEWGYPRGTRRAHPIPDGEIAELVRKLQRLDSQSRMRGVPVLGEGGAVTEVALTATPTNVRTALPPRPIEGPGWGTVVVGLLKQNADTVGEIAGGVALGRVGKKVGELAEPVLGSGAPDVARRAGQRVGATLGRLAGKACALFLLAPRAS